MLFNLTKDEHVTCFYYNKSLLIQFNSTYDENSGEVHSYISDLASLKEISRDELNRLNQKLDEFHNKSVEMFKLLREYEDKI